MSMPPEGYEHPYASDGRFTASWKPRASAEPYTIGPTEYIDVDKYDGAEDVGVPVAVASSSHAESSRKGAGTPGAGDISEHLGIPAPDASHAFRQTNLRAFRPVAPSSHRIVRDGHSTGRLRAKFGHPAKAHEPGGSLSPLPVDDEEVKEIEAKKPKSAKPPSASRKTATYDLLARQSRISTRSPVSAAAPTDVDEEIEEIESADDFPRTHEKTRSSTKAPQKSIPNTTRIKAGIGTTASAVLPFKPPSKDSRFIPDLTKVAQPRSKKEGMKPKGVSYRIFRVYLACILTLLSYRRSSRPRRKRYHSEIRWRPPAHTILLTHFMTSRPLFLSSRAYGEKTSSVLTRMAKIPRYGIRRSQLPQSCGFAGTKTNRKYS